MIVECVIDQLVSIVAPNDVIREVCEKTGMQWSDPGNLFFFGLGLAIAVGGISGLVKKKD